MTTNCRHLMRWTSVSLFIASIAGCSGSTVVQPTHPSIASGGAIESANVFFIRPEPSIGGVMRMSLTIRLGGTELLTLAKGQYTLVKLVPGSAEIKVESYTVTGPTNAITPVATTTSFTFAPHGTYYLVLQQVERGWHKGLEFVPRAVSKKSALEVAHDLTPVGMAVDVPISR